MSVCVSLSPSLFQPAGCLLMCESRRWKRSNPTDLRIVLTPSHPLTHTVCARARTRVCVCICMSKRVEYQKQPEREKGERKGFVLKKKEKRGGRNGNFIKENQRLNREAEF